jgi:hypothetical protein
VNFGPTVPLCALRLVLPLCPLCSDCEALKGLHNGKSSVHCPPTIPCVWALFRCCLLSIWDAHLGMVAATNRLIAPHAPRLPFCFADLVNASMQEHARWWQHQQPRALRTRAFPASGPSSATFSASRTPSSASYLLQLDGRLLLPCFVVFVSDSSNSFVQAHARWWQQRQPRALRTLVSPVSGPSFATFSASQTPSSALWLPRPAETPPTLTPSAPLALPLPSAVLPSAPKKPIVRQSCPSPAPSTRSRERLGRALQRRVSLPLWPPRGALLSRARRWLGVPRGPHLQPMTPRPRSQPRCPEVSEGGPPFSWAPRPRSNRRCPGVLGHHLRGPSGEAPTILDVPCKPILLRGQVFFPQYFQSWHFGIDFVL